MPAGEIQRRGAPGNRELVRPRLNLKFPLAGQEPIFEFLMDSAANAENNTAALLDAQAQTNELLRKIVDILEKTGEILEPVDP